MSRLAVSIAVLVLSAPALADDRHPDVGPNDAADACQTCHAGATPEIVKQWEDGPHGLMLVKCFVCHGSTGKDFAEHPAVSRCAGCHAEEVASVAPAKGGKRSKAAPCFACHAPHTLAAREGAASPHAAR